MISILVTYDFENLCGFLQNGILNIPLLLNLIIPLKQERFKNKKESERMYNKNDINLLNEMNRLNCKFKAVRIEYIKPKEPTRIEKIRDLIGGL